MKASDRVATGSVVAPLREGHAGVRRPLLVSMLLRVALLAGSIVMLFPFVWMVSTSLKSNADAMSSGSQLIPGQVLWSNYSDLFQQVEFGRFFVNTIVMSVGRTLGQIVTCSLAAYAFARLRFPGKNVIFMTYLAALMVPFQVIVVPEFILVKLMGWLDTYQAITVPGMFSAFGTFLLRQFFLTLPRSLEEAAILDGCGLLGVLWRVVLPLSRPALSALVIFTFLWSWNDFLWPLVATKSTDMYVLSVGLATLQGQYNNNLPAMMSGAVIASVPVLALYIALQKQFVQGIAMTGLKG